MKVKKKGGGLMVKKEVDGGWRLPKVRGELRGRKGGVYRPRGPQFHFNAKFLIIVFESLCNGQKINCQRIEENERPEVDAMKGSNGK